MNIKLNINEGLRGVYCALCNECQVVLMQACLILACKIIINYCIRPWPSFWRPRRLSAKSAASSTSRPTRPGGWRSATQSLMNTALPNTTRKGTSGCFNWRKKTEWIIASLWWTLLYQIRQGKGQQDVLTDAQLLNNCYPVCVGYCPSK